MSLKSLGRVATVVVALGVLGPIARADEIVHFLNGAEMTVRSHVVANEMLKLDLGGNNFISFPISMVDKIVNAGQNVFLNPVYYPSNQALPPTAAAPGAVPPGVSAQIGGPPVGLVRQPVPGRAGVRLGEAADALPASNFGSGATMSGANPHDDMSTAERPRFNPLQALPPGGVATIDPPMQARKPPVRMSPRPVDPPPDPAPPSGGQSGPPTPPPAESGQGSEDNRGADDSGGNDSGSQDPPPNS